MKSTKKTLGSVAFIENPRTLDRLNAACSVLLALMLVVVGWLALQPSMNPHHSNGMISLEIKAPEPLVSGAPVAETVVAGVAPAATEKAATP